MNPSQPLSRTDAIASIANVIRNAASAVYGVAETALGVIMVGAGPLVLASPFIIYDGISRLYRETPQSVKRFMTVLFTGKEPAPQKPAKPGTSLSSFVGIATGAIVTAAGLYMIVASMVLMGWLAGSAALAFAMKGGALLAVGGAVSTVSRTVSFFKNHVSFRSKDAAQQDAPSVPSAPDAAVRPSAPALAGAQAQPAFNAAVSEKKDEAQAKPAAPGVKPPED